jgi:O-acetyl-ADP-ribose deacetylase (regulator of RNase III)
MPDPALPSLLQGLIAEGWLESPPAVPDDPAGQRHLLRTLLNVRPPVPVEPELLESQDRLLAAERAAAIVTDPARLPTVREEFPGTTVAGADRMVLWRGDITTLAADAIVNAANHKLLGCFIPHHRCIDNAIHSAAGLQLRLACHRIMQEQGADEPTGGAKLTPGYNLPARHVIHTVGPIIRGELRPQDETRLESCYVSCLDLAAGRPDIKVLAFCCISTGEFRFPKPAAARIAVRTVGRWLDEARHDLRQVILNVFSEEDHATYARLFRAD